MPDELKGDERFQPTKKLKSGGQGTVWAAEDLVFGGKVAIKVLDSETISDVVFLKRQLLFEAKNMAMISRFQRPHPNVVYIIDVRSFGEDVGIVMEYVEGTSIAEKMGPRNRRQAVPISEVCDVVIQVCDGLSAAHEHKVLHRDIKPGNIMIRAADRVVKIVDWGVAKNVELAGKGSTYTGTPPFMSPEVIRLRDLSRDERVKGQGVDHRADIYSLGVTVFNMLTTRLPFDGDEEIMRGVTSKHEQILLDVGVESTFVKIILKAMDANPKNRFESASELRNAVKSWQSSHLIADDISAAWKLFNTGREVLGAEKRFQEIVERYSINPEAYLEFARFYIQCSREDDAIGILNDGIKKAPEFAPLWNARGRLYAKRNNSELAVRDLEKALSLGLPGKDEKQVKLMLNRLRSAVGRS